MPTGKITKTTVDAIAAGTRQALLWDTDVKGFGLLVMPAPSRVKTYVFQYRIGGRAGTTRRYKIGRHGSPWAPDHARERAKELRAQVERGIDPIDAERAELKDEAKAKEFAANQARRLGELAFASYVDDFLTFGLKPGTRERTSEGYASTLRNHVTPLLGSMALPEIAKADVWRVLDKIPTSQPSVRRIAFAVLRLLFNWAKSRGDISASPLEGIAPPSPVASRDRVLNDEELALAIRATGQLAKPFAQFYLLLFSTGQRREEVAALDWAELDRASLTWTLPAERSKNRAANVAPLNRHAVEALDALAGVADSKEPKWPRRGLVLSTNGVTPISGYSRAKARIDAAMLALARKDASDAGQDPEAVRVAPWRLHDARRTFATAMQRLGVRFEVTEALLNHRSGASRSGVAAVYQRHGWGPEKRAAIDAWAEFVDRALNPPAVRGNVITLRKRKRSPG